MNSFDNFRHHHKHVSFDSKRHPEHVLPKLSPMMAQNLVRNATFDFEFCVKNQSLHSYFKFSSGGVNFPAWHLTRSNLNPTDKVSGSLVDHFDQTRISTPSCSCSLYQLQIDQCIAKKVHQKINQISQSTDRGTSSIRLDLYQTSLLSHFLSIWRTVYSMLHFFSPTVYRADLSACIKNALSGGVRTANTPTFVLFSHQSATREFPIVTSNSDCSDFIFGPMRGTRSVRYSTFSQEKLQHIGVLKFSPYFSQFIRRMRLNRVHCVEQSTD